MSDFDKEPAPSAGPTTSSSAAKPAWSAPWSSWSQLQSTVGAPPGDDASGANRPWWQSLAEAPYLKPVASEPTTTPTSVSTTLPTSEPEPTSEPTPAATSGQEDPAAAEAAREQRAAQKAKLMATRSFAHTEDFDDFLFGTPPEELALIRDAYDDLVQAERKSNPSSELTPFNERFVDFVHDDQRWERMAKVDQEKVSEAVVAIFNGCDQMGTDEDTIMKQLRGKTPDELKEMERVFQATYPGKSLAGILGAEMEGDYFAEANALLGGDETTAAVYGLENALWGAGADSAKIEEILRGIPPDRRANILETYEATFGASFDDVMDGELLMSYSSSEREGLKQLGAGNDATADAHLIDHEMNGGLFGWTGDEGRQHVETILAGSKDPAAVAKAYSSVNAGKLTLDAELDEELEGPDRDVATALTDPAVTEESKRAKVAAARIMRGLTGTLDKGKVLDELTKTKGPDRDRLVAELEQNPVYRQLVHTARTQIQDPEETSDLAEFVVAFDDIEATGDSADASVFDAALQGTIDAGSIEAAKGALAGMTKAQIDARPELVDKLKAAVAGSGRDEFEVEQLALYGKPEGTPEEQLLQLHEREEAAYNHERAGGSWFTDIFSDAGEHLDERHARSKNRHDALAADGVTEEEVAELERELGYTNSARSSYATRKDEIADTTSSVVGAAALAAGTLATGGALAWLSVLKNAAVISNTAGAALGGLASMGTKWALKDNTYGSDEKWKDAGMTAVGMGAAALSQTEWLGNLFKNVKNDTLIAGGKGALTGVAAGTGQGVVNSIDNGKVDGETFFYGVLGQAAGGAVGNMVGGAIEKPWLDNVKANFPAGSKDHLWKALPVKAAAGFAGGAVGGGAQAAMDPGTYDGDASSFLMKTGLSGFGGALGNVAQGLAEGYGDHSSAKIDAAKAAHEATAPTPAPLMTPDVAPTPATPITPATDASMTPTVVAPETPLAVAAPDATPVAMAPAETALPVTSSSGTPDVVPTPDAPMTPIAPAPDAPLAVTAPDATPIAMTPADAAPAVSPINAAPVADIPAPPLAMTPADPIPVGPAPDSSSPVTEPGLTVATPDAPMVTSDTTPAASPRPSGGILETLAQLVGPRQDSGSPPAPGVLLELAQLAGIAWTDTPSQQPGPRAAGTTVASPSALMQLAQLAGFAWPTGDDPLASPRHPQDGDVE